MPMRAVRRGGKSYPAVVCEYCDTEIEDAAGANALWDPDSREMFFTHDACNEAFLSCFGGQPWREPLDSLLFRLLHNPTSRPEGVEDRVEMLERLP